MKLTIESSSIKALLAIAAKEDVRYYLNGICVDSREDGAVVLVATDGHKMLAVRLAPDAVDDWTAGQWIINRDILESVKPMKAGRTEFPITVNIVQPESYQDSEGRTIKPVPAITVCGVTTATTPPVDGRFPDWRRVVPEDVATTTPEPSQFNPEYVATFGKVAKLLQDKKDAFPYIHQRGNNPALITGLGDMAIGILMPMRATADSDGSLPYWAFVIPCNSESKAA